MGIGVADTVPGRTELPKRAPRFGETGEEKMSMRWFVLGIVVAFGLSSTAFGGDAFLTFDADVGPLTFHASGAGAITANSGKAVVSGGQITLMSNDGGSTAAVSTDAVTVTMVVRPATDAGTGLGVIIVDDDNPTQTITALTSTDGLVTLIDWIGNFQNVQFDFPNASNNSLILTYDPFTERATLNINNSASPADTVFLETALNGGTQTSVGVASNGTGEFDTLIASGNGINTFPFVDSDGDGTQDIDDAFPNNPFGATDSDGDGLGDEWEDFWFGDGNGTATPGELAIADNTTDFDSDGVSDSVEFLFAVSGLDPTDGASSLPAGTFPGLIVLVTFVLSGALWRRRRVAC